MTYPAAKDIKTAAESVRIYKQLMKAKKPRKENYPYLFRALKLEPDHPEANFLKGKAILDYHYVQWPEALDCFNITITSGWKRRLVWALTLKGSLLVHLDRQQEAEGVLNQALTTGANQLTYLTAYFGDKLYVRLVRELIRTGLGEWFNNSTYELWVQHYLDDENTKKSIERMGQKHDEFLELEEKGDAAVKKGDWKEAVKQYKKALEIATYTPLYRDGFRVYNRQFRALRELEEFSEARIIASKMTERFYFHKQTWRNKGISDLRSKRYKEGIESFERALELGDESVVSWNGKAAALLELKQYPEAMKCVTHVLEKDPDNKYAQQVHRALKEILE